MIIFVNSLEFSLPCAMFFMKLQKMITRISKKEIPQNFFLQDVRCKIKLQLPQFNNVLADNSLINVTIKTPYKTELYP